ncbi:GGDEF domain-containing response regulator [Salinarimonas sp. NSM]|uniref:GGDEF domain-containing response regulator n=1 Tax=Salinarimonas sp. NSM TaxID=3458003 RepID=UPI004035B039
MHIVVVDSSRVVLKMVAGLLAPKGHQVETFTDSREALAFVTDTPSVDALITSLETRPIGGFELCWSARLLAEDRRPLYIIAMSSTDNARNLSEALDSGADDFLSKPPVAEELNARLRAAQRLTTLQRELIRLAETDSLTGLLNRGAFIHRLGEAARRHGPQGRLALIGIDLDHFKKINDGHGHAVGDAAIRAAGEVLAAVARDHKGFAGRVGGEEYALALPGMRGMEASDVANTLRGKISEIRVRGRSGPVKFTASLGVGEWSDGETVEGLMKRADLALFDAKANGRDRVMTAFSDVYVSRVG